LHSTAPLPPHSFHTFLLTLLRPPPTSTLFPYTTLFRSVDENAEITARIVAANITVAGVLSGEITCRGKLQILPSGRVSGGSAARSEEHTSELQSQSNLVCRLLLETKKKNQNKNKKRIDI